MSPVELEIDPGRDRDGFAETCGPLHLRTGDLVALVGPTGSGKSRLLADIEWLSQGDSPSGRRVRIRRADGSETSDDPLHRVAQLSQGMQFTLDLDVGAFLELHAKARGIDDPVQAVAMVVDAACTLCGEPFSVRTHLSALSGGQSRALMVADTAILARAPVVLVDEVENAGVDRRKAMELLVSREKIVLMATHDPLLALLARWRLVFARGGIQAVRERSEAEEFLLSELEILDREQSRIRERLR
ncbi:MAG TPA: ATP-binding cassette domain-containing protein, partial [Fibrobacteria bacterium]|nr:ATP-binding cassette domain-containing protein [Fibrobacteria bacterium]